MTYKDFQNLEIIPSGWRSVHIAEIDLIEAITKDCIYIRVALVVVGGPFQNRKLFDNFIVDHRTSNVASTYGLEKLNELITIVGGEPIVRGTDAEHFLNRVIERLYNKQLDANIGRQESANTIYNSIEGYKE